jgi:uncharacterized protein
MLRFPAMKGRTLPTIALAILMAPIPLVSLLRADAGASPEAAAAATDPIAQIALRHQRRDSLFSRMIISPLTAASSYHVDPGKAVRIGADEDSFQMDPNGPMPYRATLTAGVSGLWVAPVAGAPPPRVHESSGDGEPIPGEGAAIEAPHKLKVGDLVALGRFLLQVSSESGGARVMVFDPDAAMKKSFHGFKWFDPDPRLQVKAKFTPEAAPPQVKVATSQGTEAVYYKVGTFDFTIDDKPQRLTALSRFPAPRLGITLFMPFRDPTNGSETYANGRYLEMKYKGADDAQVLDFNTATNPYCSYSPFYYCPLPLKENTLTVPIRAGEMIYAAH